MRRRNVGWGLLVVFQDEHEQSDVLGNGWCNLEAENLMVFVKRFYLILCGVGNYKKSII